MDLIGIFKQIFFGEKAGVDNLTQEFFAKQRLSMRFSDYTEWLLRQHIALEAEAREREEKGLPISQELADGLLKIEKEMGAVEKQTGKPLLGGKKILK